MKRRLKEMQCFHLSNTTSSWKAKKSVASEGAGQGRFPLQQLINFVFIYLITRHYSTSNLSFLPGYCASPDGDIKLELIPHY
jgi:hypothetical protein